MIKLIKRVTYVGYSLYLFFDGSVFLMNNLVKLEQYEIITQTYLSVLKYLIIFALVNICFSNT